MEPNSPTPTEAVAVPSPEPAQPKKKSKFAIFLAIIAGVLLLSVAIYLFVLNATGSAAKVSDDFVTAIQKDDPSKAYTLTSDDFKKSTTETELSSIITTVSPALQGSTTNNDRRIESKGGKEYTVIVYTVKTSQGDKYIRVVLQKLNKEWKVINFRSSAEKLEAVIE